MPVAPQHLWAEEYLTSNARAEGRSAILNAGISVTALRKNACILELNGATEARIKNERAAMQAIAQKVQQGEFDFDLIVVTGRIRAGRGFAAVSQAAKQTLELEAA